MKHLAHILAALLLILAVCSIKAVIYEKRCLIIDESYDFDEKRYYGKWYEIRRLYNPEEVELDDCVQVVHTQDPDTKENFNIIRAAQQGPTGEVIYSSATAMPAVYKRPYVPKFIYRYNTSDAADPDSHMDIVKTDYVNFSIVYSCNPINTTMVSENAWIYSREPVLKKQTADLINTFVEKHFNHPVHKWRTTEQSTKICKPNTLPDNKSSALMIGMTFWSTMMSLAVACFLAKMSL